MHVFSKPSHIQNYLKGQHITYTKKYFTYTITIAFMLQQTVDSFENYIVIKNYKYTFYNMIRFRINWKMNRKRLFEANATPRN